MELRTTQELRRNEQLTKATVRKTEGACASAKPDQAQQPKDKLTISRQALSWLEEQNRKMWEEDMERQQRRQDRMNDSLSAMDSAKHELDVMEKAMKVLRLCQKIAASIMKGDNVPPEDLKYLMDNDPNGYKLAIAMRRPKEDPEDVESVLEKEENKGEESAQSAEGTTPAPETSSGGEVSTGGGDAAGAE